MKNSRILKFRAWNKEISKMAYFITPRIITDSPTTYLRFEINNWFSLNTRTGCLEAEYYAEELDTDDPIVMQYTGLKDKNGKEIYEGDVISAFCGTQKAEVFFDLNYGCWGVYLKKSGSASVACELLANNLSVSEVIGNIYQNPKY